MQFVQLTEYKRKNIFFKNHAKNKARGLVPGLFLFSEKALHEAKASAVRVTFNIFR